MQFVMLGIVLLSFPYSIGKIFYYNVVVELEHGNTVKAMFNALLDFVITIFGLAVTYWLLSCIPMLGHLINGYMQTEEIRSILMILVFAEVSVMMLMIAGKFWIEH